MIQPKSTNNMPSPSVSVSRIATISGVPGLEAALVVMAEALLERAAQIMRGYTPAHDDQHHVFQLIDAMQAYALKANLRREEAAARWPFADGFDTTKSPRQSLITAIALGIAAVERIDRESATVAAADQPAEA